MARRKGRRSFGSAQSPSAQEARIDEEPRATIQNENKNYKADEYLNGVINEKLEWIRGAVTNVIDGVKSALSPSYWLGMKDCVEDFDDEPLEQEAIEKRAESLKKEIDSERSVARYSMRSLSMALFVVPFAPKEFRPFLYVVMVLSVARSVDNLRHAKEHEERLKSLEKELEKDGSEKSPKNEQTPKLQPQTLMVDKEQQTDPEIRTVRDKIAKVVVLPVIEAVGSQNVSMGTQASEHSTRRPDYGTPPPSPEYKNPEARRERSDTISSVSSASSDCSGSRRTRRAFSAGTAKADKTAEIQAKIGARNEEKAEQERLAKEKSEQKRQQAEEKSRIKAQELANKNKADEFRKKKLLEKSFAGFVTVKQERDRIEQENNNKADDFRERKLLERGIQGFSENLINKKKFREDFLSKFPEQLAKNIQKVEGFLEESGLLRNEKVTDITFYGSGLFSHYLNYLPDDFQVGDIDLKLKVNRLQDIELDKDTTALTVPFTSRSYEFTKLKTWFGRVAAGDPPRTKDAIRNAGIEIAKEQTGLPLKLNITLENNNPSPALSEGEIEDARIKSWFANFNGFELRFKEKGRVLKEPKLAVVSGIESIIDESFKNSYPQLALLTDEIKERYIKCFIERAKEYPPILNVENLGAQRVEIYISRGVYKPETASYSHKVTPEDFFRGLSDHLGNSRNKGRAA